MPSSTRRELIAGPAGKIECAVDEPAGRAARGVALVAHPHPLFGGSLDNKVAQTLARAFVELGYAAWAAQFPRRRRERGETRRGARRTGRPCRRS